MELLMAKRFTDTEKWRKPWYRKLKTKNKVLWQYFLDNCDHAGFIKIDVEVIKMDTNETFTREEIESTFEGKIFKMDNDYYWIAKFIEFQYSAKFLENNDRCTNSIKDRLMKFGVSYSNNNGRITPIIEGASKGLVSPYVGPTDTVIVTVKDINTKENSKNLSDAECEKLKETLGDVGYNLFISEFPQKYVDEKIEDLSAWLINRPLKKRWTKRGLFLGIKKCLKKDEKDWKSRNNYGDDFLDSIQKLIKETREGAAECSTNL
jgi:hypothetical protein